MAQVNIGENERAVSALGGGAMTLIGMRGGTPAGLALAALGGYMVYRGLSGRCLAYEALGVNTAESGAGERGERGERGEHVERVEKVMTINRPADGLYRFWRRLENLPRFMRHLESVEQLDERRSRWVATGPAGSKVTWEAEIVEDRPGEAIAWRSLPDSQVQSEGSVHFSPAPGGRGTEVRVTMDYRPPAGQLGAAVARLLGEDPARQVEEELRHFKQLTEAGEIAAARGQAQGPRSAAGKLADRLQHADEPAPGSQAAPDASRRRVYEGT